ncbi:hypothetical protein BGW41_000727 [Actinomortierella wolfii]|nr:hypothetical protein BGW41_000727 [Actinomortierella wolfii]
MSEHIDPNQTIYVRNLNDKIKKDAFGRIISITALKTMPHRGQAFITFSDLTSATAALRGLQGFEFYGKAMDIHYAKTKSHSIAKLDGTYKQPPLRNHIQTTTVAAATKRAREADSESDSE